MRLAWAGCARSATAEAGKSCYHRRRRKRSNASSGLSLRVRHVTRSTRCNAGLGLLPFGFVEGLVSRGARLAALSGNLTICSVLSDRSSLVAPLHNPQLSASNIIILSADKELSLPRRYRRLAGVGFHCLPDGPQRKERIWDLWRMRGLLPPTETPEER